VKWHIKTFEEFICSHKVHLLTRVERMSSSKLTESDRSEEGIYNCRHRHDPEIIVRLEE